MPNRLADSVRFRVIVDNVSFYATAKQIRTGVGDFTRCNNAVQKALTELEREMESIPVRGLAGCWENMNVQLDIA